MIHFFRKMRKSLSEEGKITKYIKYAIGEIFLVVIGILIALQINNWNENRKADENERVLLSKLREENNLNLNTLQDYVTYRDSISGIIADFITVITSKNIQSNTFKIQNYLEAILASTIYTFTQSNLLNYINTYNNKTSSLNRELTTLQFYQKDLEMASTKGIDIKIENVYKTLENSIDFTTGEIKSFEMLTSLKFRNNMIFVASAEYDISLQFKKTYRQIKKVDSLISIKLK
ncbi:DUF6090 family protein [Polaribacter sp. R77954]|uniref:DUF6090 family protein n=1 Tax=Polaribacter sp. R77954 TaxID=3093870 RepID=UPI0037CB7857